jgi:hypothetical protein
MIFPLKAFYKNANKIAWKYSIPYCVKKGGSRVPKFLSSILLRGMDRQEKRKQSAQV